MINLNKQDKEYFLDKSKLLNQAKNKLQQEFVGLDDIIEELVEMVEPWFLFPDGQMRPQVINLFGMTGTGKTSLVNRLFELLNMSSVINFDTGEWVEKTEYQLSSNISTSMKKTLSDNTRPVLIFDEFQLGRTIDEHGLEIDRPNLRVVWDLLDSGKFTVVEDNWQSFEIQTLYNKLNLLIKNGLTAKHGKIIKNKKEWELYFDKSELTDDEKKHQIKEYTLDPIIPSNIIYVLNECSNDFLSEKELKKYILTLETEDDILKFVEKILVTSTKPVEYDFSNAIIFIIGNLDGAYTMAHDMNADIDADDLYEYTKKINISDIKTALDYLYRPEQISRLGNNYILYKSLNTESYYKLIDLELNKIKNKIKNKFEISIEFSNKTKKLLYKEGVFATQGVRPIFSTITALIETKISKLIVDSLKENIDINKVYWDTNRNKTKFILTLNNNIKKEYDLILKVDSLRKSKNDDIQALVGVHESGHVLCHVYDMNICPSVAVSKTLVDGGFTRTEKPSFETKKFLEQELVAFLGGYAAEQIIFGKDNLTNGSYSDIEKTTELALSMIKEYGMNNTPLQYAKSDFRVSTKALDDKNLDDEVERIVKKALNRATEILTDNIELLLEMGKYLTKNSKITDKQIKRMVKKYGSYNEPIYKTKDTYYNFKEILMNKK
jgi:cell division protease FtsH